MLNEKITQLKHELGNNLCIMGHHYQCDDVIQHVDIVGDSLELASKISQIQSKNIVFCGVHFMAETATLLAKEKQYIHIPDSNADCVMAQMAPAALLDTVLTKLNNGKRKVIPVAYINTTLAIKSVVGKFNGVVCTSSNASKVLAWALEQSKQYGEPSVLFLPDGNLGTNTAQQLHIPLSEIEKIDIRQNGQHIQSNSYSQSKVLLWPGCCAVHAKIQKKHVDEIRKQYPDAHIAVHPECNPDVVQAVDSFGSTSYLIKTAASLAPNSTFIIGTEDNLVQRLANQHKSKITILPLHKVICSNMAKITELALYNKLLEIKSNQAKPFSIDTSLSSSALLSIQRMLALS